MESEILVENIFLDSIKIKKESLKQLGREIQKSIDIILEALRSGKKVLVCGNGGSAADSQHFAGELICTFENSGRKSLPAISLTTNTSIITAYANDFSFEEIFSRQIEGLGEKGDVLVGLTTSGNSVNILKAFEKAKEKGVNTICFSGRGGGKSNKMDLDSNLVVPSNSTARIQETHITVIHAICSAIEKELFG